MKRSADFVLLVIVGLLASLVSPIAAQAAYPDPPQGSGYPYTRVIAGQHSKADCPVGFQHANGLISDLSWPSGQRSFTECWPEAAFVANRIGGNTWQAFKDSGGTLSVDELYAIQQAWRDYDQAIEDAQSAAAAESKKWNEANPGKQKCVQWGPIVAPDGVGQSSGGVCANPVSAPVEASTSPEASEESAGSTSSEDSENSGGNGSGSNGSAPAPAPAPAPEGDLVQSESSPVSSSDQAASASENTEAAVDEKIAIPEPTNLKLTSDTSAVYLTVENGKSKKVSVRFAGKWSVFYPTSDLETKAFYPGQSGFVSITVYVDGALKLSNFVKIDEPRGEPSDTATSPDTPSAPKGSGYPFSEVVSGQIGKAQCPAGKQYANGLIVDVSTGLRYTECWPEAAYLAWSLGGETWSAFKASNGATSVAALRKALEERNSPSPTNSESASIEPVASESNEVVESSSPSIKVSRDENSVKIQVLNAEGRKLSARIAGRWLVTYLPDDDHIVTRRVLPGVPVNVSTYLDGELVATETLTTGQASETFVPVVPEATPSPSTSDVVAPPSTSQTTSEQAKIVIATTNNEIEFEILNASGRKVSIQIGGRWLVEYPETARAVVRTTSVKGATVGVRIFVDSVLLQATSIEVGADEEKSVIEKPNTDSAGSSSSGTVSQTTSGPATAETTSEFSSSDGQILVDITSAEGRKVSLKVGGRWFVFYPTSSPFRYSVNSLVGAIVEVSLYVDGELSNTGQLTVGG